MMSWDRPVASSFAVIGLTFGMAVVYAFVFRFDPAPADMAVAEAVEDVRGLK